MLDQILLPFSAVFGAIVGSFLNAAIYRMPRNISLVRRSRSFCPRCNATIAWYDNIPLLSYLVLRGRCRSCHRGISLRYPLVELLTAGLFAALYWHVRMLNGPGSARDGASALLDWKCLIVYMPLTAGLILAAFVDLQDYEETEQERKETAERHAALKKAGRDPAAEDGPAVYGIIPDEVTLTGLALALPLALLLPETHWNRAEILQGWPRMNALFDAAIGAVAGGALIYGMGVFGKVAFRKEAMGLGDVKLLAMLGGLLGWQAAVMIFFIAPVFGSIFGLALMLMTGERYARYGPFLAAAAVLVIFYEPLAAMYCGSILRPGWEQPQLHHRVPLLEPDGMRQGL